ncbi:Beta-barrel assembly machine subunit BamD [Desulfonatronum thiosulfatophilum]|uniref:Beta-barrel assembly machine subunit BamD n=1 Tax=Desulfonatronum thiosulfatophilum TaxID=617002 RepID=A0A1G6BJP5_9BACT|nr:outer membrane protein assembly factor BamD [Desulfonatronum thiosulfatophilum]SDB20808.1 Beta-barrel assembly machine subunit BamD [Desulfonatronum thiosulfatophilum]
MKTTPIRALLPCLLLTFLISGCGIIDYYFLTPPEDTAQELAQAGFEAMESKEYRQAITYFTKLKDRYPFSPFTSAAELALADAYFLSEQYDAAVQTYLEFESLHPGHESIPYVLFQVGMSYLKQFRSIDRPTDNLHLAVQYFTRVQQTFPDSVHAHEAGEFITQARTRIAESELFVADFYWRRGQYGPAWHRYQQVSREFADIDEIAEYAARQGDFAYYRFQKQQSREDREEREGTWKRLLDWL